MTKFIAALWLCCMTLSATWAAENIETRIHMQLNPGISGPLEFGKSLAIHSARSTLYAGAPQLNDQGGMFSCRLSYGSNNNRTKSCNSIALPGEGSGRTGTVMAKLTTDDYLVVCGNQHQISCPDQQITQRLIGKCYNYYLIEGGFEDFAHPLCPTECPERSLVADLVFVIDGSGSVQLSPFLLGLNWIATILAGFRNGIDDGKLQVGYVVFNSDITSSVRPSQKTYNDLRNEIIRISYPGGGTRTDLAIQEADRQLSSTSRDDVTKMMIVITDGKSNEEELTKTSATAAKAKGNFIISVGVGAGVSMAELEYIASPPINTTVMTVDDYDNLDSILDQLSQVIAETASVSLEGGVSNATNELTSCQFGTSVHASSSGVYIGAVGAYDRTGTVAEYDDLSPFPNIQPSDHLNSTELENIFGSLKNSLKDSYFGYSVTSGAFVPDTTEWVVMSAPRYLSRGAVLIHNDEATQHLTLHPSDASGYWQLGGYYGHTVFATDVNKDGMDDLLVSAPLYSEVAGYDEGVVLVYLNDESDPGAQNWVSASFQPAILKGGSVPGGRFGMHIVSAGDIDKNGFSDVIIGAPTEESTTQDGSGAIYLYFASQDGISDDNKQKILGRHVASGSETFKSFGLAAHGGSDFDGNGYTDLAVSAPSSDRVVLLRSRKVILTTLTTSVSPDDIDLISCATNPTTVCSTVRICLSAYYSDGITADTFGLTYNMTLDSLIGDPNHKRMHFLSSGLSLISQTSTVGNSPICQQFDMQLKTEAMGALNGGGLEVTPQVELSVDFSQAHKDTIMSGVMSPDSETKKTADWSISKGCSGSSDRCEHDLILTAVFSDSSSSTPIVLDGSGRKLTMTANIQNSGPDYAFFLKVNITSGNLTVIKTTGSCIEESISEGDSTTGLTVLKYKSGRKVFGDRMLSGESCDFSVEFDFSRLQTIASEPTATVTASIYSNAGGDSVAFDEDKSNNAARFERPLQYISNQILDGSAMPTQVFFNQTTDDNRVILTTLEDAQLGGSDTDMTHSYTIYNSGPLGLANAKVKVTWPEKTQSGHFLLYLVNVRCEPETACTCETEGKANPLNIAPTSSSFGSYLTEYETALVSPSEAFTSSTPVTCDNTLCNDVFCNLTYLATFSKVTVLAEFKPWIPTFGKEFSSVDISSALEIVLASTTLSSSVLVKQLTTNLTMYDPSEPPAEPTPGGPNVGAIIGGILAGLVLLAIIIAAMWKAGFFKSKYGKMTREARKSIREAGARGDASGGPDTDGGDFNKSTEDLCE